MRSECTLIDLSLSNSPQVRSVIEIRHQHLQADVDFSEISEREPNDGESATREALQKSSLTSLRVECWLTVGL